LVTRRAQQSRPDLFFQAENDYDWRRAIPSSPRCAEAGKIADIKIYPPSERAKRMATTLPARQFCLGNDVIAFLERHCDKVP